MRITGFKIENFRNIRLAECINPPDFMVICGGNGCGKSALLNALMTAKEHAGSYGNYRFDHRAVSADADQARISLTLEFENIERDFVKKKFNQACNSSEQIVVEINRGGNAKTVQRSNAAHLLLSHFSRAHLDSPGFFEFIDAYRRAQKTELSNWDASFLSDERAKQTLSAAGEQKFQSTKAYLAGLKMRDLQDIQSAIRTGKSHLVDSLESIRRFFDEFFSPMKFVDVRIDESPFRYIVNTPRGEIDIDDLSSGEKEVLNTFVRFHQLNPRRAIILFCEADAHLHPDLERRYLEVLRRIGTGNQLWLTTHSPEMMIAAGSSFLYTVLKDTSGLSKNQFVRVTTSDELHNALSEVMGSRGLVSFNQRIVFIEGEEASADREVYEKLYPPGQHHVSFVPAGNSATIRRTAERINDLLSSSMEFQHYYSIVDRDIDRSAPAPTPSSGRRLFQLPVYHVENFLLLDDVILAATRDLLASECPFHTAADVESALKTALISPQHMKPYSRAIQDGRLAQAAKQAADSVFQGKAYTPATVPCFAHTEEDSLTIMREAIRDGTWREKCKGRDVLRALAGQLGLNYEHFRNLIISKLTQPPTGLAEIMDQILV